MKRKKIQKWIAAGVLSIVFSVLMMMPGFAEEVVCIFEGKTYAPNEKFDRVIMPGETVKIKLEGRDSNTGEPLKLVSLDSSGDYDDNITISLDTADGSYLNPNTTLDNKNLFVKAKLVGSTWSSRTYQFTIPKPFGEGKYLYQIVHMRLSHPFFINGYSQYAEVLFDTYAAEKKTYQLKNEGKVPAVLHAGESATAGFYVTDQFNYGYPVVSISPTVLIDGAEKKPLQITEDDCDVTFTADNEIDDVYEANVTLKIEYRTENYGYAVLKKNYNIKIVPADWVEPEDPPENNEILPEKITLNKKTASLIIGGSLQLREKITPGDATDQNVTWKSSNKKIATVSSAGLVKAKKAGVVTISVRTSNGRKAACKITVKKVKTVKVKNANIFKAIGNPDYAGKVSAKVKKGKTTLSVKDGIISFKAPKTGTYSFTFSGITSIADSSAAVFADATFYSYGMHQMKNSKISTKGGKTAVLRLSSKTGKQTSGAMIKRSLPSRTGKVKLKKGDVIYIYLSCGYADKGSFVDLKIS